MFDAQQRGTPRAAEHAQFSLRVMLVNGFHDVLTQETKSASDEVSRHVVQ
jgi:hypothetical protein